MIVILGIFLISSLRIVALDVRTEPLMVATSWLSLLILLAASIRAH